MVFRVEYLSLGPFIGITSARSQTRCPPDIIDAGMGIRHFKHYIRFAQPDFGLAAHRAFCKPAGSAGQSFVALAPFT
jgi:hypothetical protein